MHQLLVSIVYGNRETQLLVYKYCDVQHICIFRLSFPCRTKQNSSCTIIAIAIYWNQWINFNRIMI